MKYVKTLLVVCVLGSMFGMNSPYVYAWDDCVKGKVNDPYPGDCARYIDTDGNGICDHSEPAPEDRVPENSSSLHKEAQTEAPQYAYAGDVVSSGNDRGTSWVSLVASSYTQAAFFTVMSLVVISLYAVVHKQKIKDL